MEPTYNLDLTLAQLNRILMWNAAYEAMANMKPAAAIENEALRDMLYETLDVLESEAEPEPDDD